MCTSDAKMQNLKSTDDATYKRIAEDLASELQINQEKNSRTVNRLKRKLEKNVDLQERKIKKAKIEVENLKSKLEAQKSEIQAIRYSCKK